MSGLRYIASNLWMTLLRFVPIRCRVGVLRVGNPSRQSPVLLTGNYRLTVLRVLHALRGLDAWLLVANSRGVNVWCAATGGMLSDHEVLSVLKTSGIADCVDHRDVVLPQLAATGIRADWIEEKIGWTVRWGPVEATDLPAYLASGRAKTSAMSVVCFPWFRRFEMAVAWAFPMSLLIPPLLLFRPGAWLPAIGLVWLLSSAVFFAFPLLQRTGQQPGQKLSVPGGAFGGSLLVWGASVLGLFLVGNGAGGEWVFWSVVSLVILLVLGLDLSGSTPTCKSRLHRDGRLRITLDADRCDGVGVCAEVCPRDVFSVGRVAEIARADACVNCGACIVQCPCDALSFTGPEGKVVPPATIRRFKLNLLGKRAVDTRR